MLTPKPLTPQRERFALELVKGVSQADAYRVAYPKSLKWTDSALWGEASKLAKNPQVIHRLNELRAAAAQVAVLDAATVLGNIGRIANKAEEAGEFGAALKGHELLGKHLKLFTEKHELGGIGGGSILIQASRADEDL